MTTHITNQTEPVTAYAVAYLRDVHQGPEIVEYLHRIDDTLQPYGGQFLVHGGPLTPLEGEWAGDIVIIAFPSWDAALGWYHSPAYAEILPLRTEHSVSIAAVAEGVEPGHRAIDVLEPTPAARLDGGHG